MVTKLSKNPKGGKRTDKVNASISKAENLLKKPANVSGPVAIKATAQKLKEQPEKKSAKA